MHLHYHAECRAEVQGKEGKYSVFMSRLSLHLLGSAGSCFCLIKGWLMNGATEGDGKIQEKRQREKKEEHSRVWTSLHTHGYVRRPCLPLSELEPDFAICFVWQEREQLGIASFSHTFSSLKSIKRTWSFEEGFLISGICEWRNCCSVSGQSSVSIQYVLNPAHQSRVFTARQKPI